MSICKVLQTRRAAAAIGAALCAALLWGGPAQAALCPPDQTPDLTGWSSGCEDLPYSNDTVKGQLVVNDADGTFGENDWDQIIKYQLNVASGDIYPDVTGGIGYDAGTATATFDGDITFVADSFGSDGSSDSFGFGGEFIISQTVIDIYDELLVLMKGASNLGLVALELDLSNLDATGNQYQSVFYNGTTLKQISHMSFYGRIGSSAAVPVPAAAPMLLAALGGLAWVRRRKD